MITLKELKDAVQKERNNIQYVKDNIALYDTDCLEGLFIQDQVIKGVEGIIKNIEESRK